MISSDDKLMNYKKNLNFQKPKKAEKNKKFERIIKIQFKNQFKVNLTKQPYLFTIKSYVSSFDKMLPNWIHNNCLHSFIKNDRDRY
jgi:hypothetical protein